MTDAEIIELLRNSPFTFNDIVADRIEELDEELVLAQDATNHWIIAYNNMEAKLTKAVKALRDVVSAKGLTDPIEYGYDAIKRARAVLEELEKPE